MLLVPTGVKAAMSDSQLCPVSAVASEALVNALMWGSGVGMGGYLEPDVWHNRRVSSDSAH